MKQTCFKLSLHLLVFHSSTYVSSFSCALQTSTNSSQCPSHQTFNTGIFMSHLWFCKRVQRLRKQRHLNMLEVLARAHHIPWVSNQAWSMLSRKQIQTMNLLSLEMCHLHTHVAAWPWRLAGWSWPDGSFSFSWTYCHLLHPCLSWDCFRDCWCHRWCAACHWLDPSHRHLQLWWSSWNLPVELDVSCTFEHVWCLQLPLHFQNVDCIAQTSS